MPWSTYVDIDHVGIPKVWQILKQFTRTICEESSFQVTFYNKIKDAIFVRNPTLVVMCSRLTRNQTLEMVEVSVSSALLLMMAASTSLLGFCFGGK